MATANCGRTGVFVSGPCLYAQFSKITEVIVNLNELLCQRTVCCSIGRDTAGRAGGLDREYKGQE